ncbi:MAG: peptidase M13, partial [Acidimicrobiales bacterium]|nr:peptidase M13 [Acidimicrobiales bacterium]
MASGIDLTERNPDVRPQDDLFRHVNGAWLDRAVIPEDRASDGTFHRLRDQSEERVRDLLDELAGAPADPGSEAQQVGDLYASFLDEDRIESLDASPITDDLAAISALDSIPGLARLLGSLVRSGGPGAFALAVYPDAKEPDRYGLYLTQDGLGLPDEAFYREDQFAEIRAAYVQHVSTMLGLVDTPDPDDAAARVMALETRIAGHHWDNVRDRDAQATYNPLDRAGLDALTPTFPWTEWLAGLDAPEDLLDAVIVREPDFFTGFDGALQEVPLEDWKAWLTWQVVHDAAPMLSSRFVDANFDFYGRLLTGAEELRARWKRGVGVVESALGEALGKLYVARHFPPEAKDQMLALVANLLEAYRRSITDLDWMTDATKERALEKLGTFTPKIGYPD